MRGMRSGQCMDKVQSLQEFSHVRPVSPGGVRVPAKRFRFRDGSDLLVNRIPMNRSIVEGLGRFFCRLSNEQFFGVVEVQFQEGEIVLVRKQESFKPAKFLSVE